MVEFQLLDVDYVNVNGKPIIRIFGKTEDGESVCAFYENFVPYFYAEDGADRVLEGEPQVIEMERVTKKMVMGYNVTKQLYKIKIKDPSKTPELRERLSASGIKTYEADILFKYRFLTDLDMQCLGWIRTNVDNGAATNTVSVDKKIELKDMEKLDKEKDAPLKIMAFDIECIAMEAGNVPDSKTDPIILISVVFSEPYKGQKSMVLGTRTGRGVNPYTSEKEMLEGFVNIINEYDPDIITGYNVNNFDIPYVVERMRQNKVKPVFGRCNEKQVMARKIGNRYKVSISGRIIVDSFELVKKDFSLKRYGLDYVSQNLLNEKKVDVKHSEIERLWKGSTEEFEKLVNYSRVDSVLAMNLVQKLNLIDKYVALSKISGTLLQDTLNMGETTRIENFLLREFNRRGYVYSGRPNQSEVSRREKNRRKELKGGFVLEPEKGLHSSVLVLDFKSMYPSIIRSFNICPTTLLTNESQEPPEDVITTVAGTKFVSKNVKEGIIPHVLEKLMKKRQETKRALKKEKDPAKKKSLHARQWALKILANAFYGHMGYVRAKIYNLDIANTITSSGRDIIHKTKTEIEKKYGYKVVYGDTDSVMVKVDNETDMQKIRQIGTEISKHITEKLPGYLELEFEKFFKQFLPLTKKRYVAWKFEPDGDGWQEGIEMKGIETVRRDWCDLVSETLSEIIEIILKKGDVKGALEYFKSVIKNLMRNKIPTEKLVITKTITKAPGKYEGIQPHIEAAKKITARNPNEAPGIGDRIGYVIIKGTDMLSKRAEDPTFVAERGIEIDPKYYIENQLLPPMERIFSVLSISKSELLGNGKQMGLMEAINNYNETNHIKVLPRTETNGFICTKCSKFYPRIPLVGTCECGGELAFSSPKGMVKQVTL